jgi:hypothetical protein
MKIMMMRIIMMKSKMQPHQHYNSYTHSILTHLNELNIFVLHLCFSFFEKKYLKYF